MKSIFALLFCLLLSFSVFCQDQAPEMADSFRASGKIYVVVGVATIILIGLLLYLVSIDRKVKRLENEFRSKTGSNRS
jgi:fumarate reductase subunit C